MDGSAGAWKRVLCVYFDEVSLHEEVGRQRTPSTVPCRCGRRWRTADAPSSASEPALHPTQHSRGTPLSTQHRTGHMPQVHHSTHHRCSPPLTGQLQHQLHPRTQQPNQLRVLSTATPPAGESQGWGEAVRLCVWLCEWVTSRYVLHALMATTAATRRE